MADADAIAALRAQLQEAQRQQWQANDSLTHVRPQSHSRISSLPNFLTMMHGL